MPKKFRNPFGKSKKKKDKAAKGGNPSLGVENSTQQIGALQQDNSVLDLAFDELEGRNLFDLSSVERNARAAHDEGNGSDFLDDRAYFALAGRTTQSYEAQQAARGQRFRAREALRNGEGGVTQQDVEAKEAGFKHIEESRKAMKSVRDDQRQRFLGRHTKAKDSQLTSERILGKGAVGEVHEVKRHDGTSAVFKAEGDAPEAGKHLGIDTAHAMGASREVASSRMNDMLGSNVIANTRFAEMDGQRGSVMDFAQGRSSIENRGVDGMSPEAIAKGEELGLVTTTGDGEFKKQEIEVSSDLDYSDPVLQRQLIELQIQDALSGQFDRHGHNYHVQRDDKGKVTGVTGFDNDGSFGKDATSWKEVAERENERVGGRKFANTVGLPPLMDASQAARIDGLDPVRVYREISEVLPHDEAEAAVMRLHEMKEHVEELRSTGGIVEEWNGETFARLMAGDATSSYVARDASYLADLRSKEAEFEAWKHEQGDVQEEVHQLQEPKANAVELADGDGGGKKKKKKSRFRNPFKRKKKKK